MTTYEVIARRTGDWWALDVPAVPGAHSQCKRLDQAADAITEAIAMVLDVDEDSFDVTVTPKLEEALENSVNAAVALRNEAEVVFVKAQEAQHKALDNLVNRGRLSHRDAGALIGLSHQRVSQVLNQKADA